MTKYLSSELPWGHRGVVILLQGRNGIDLDKPDNHDSTLSSLLLSRDAKEQRSYSELASLWGE